MYIPELKDAEDIILMVIKKKAPAAILVSEGGLGKSHLALSEAEKHCPGDYVYRSGHITPLSLYILLYENRGGTIIFDDIEELFKNDTAVGILKAALWPIKGKRIVTYTTTSDKIGDTPQEFEFNGGVILLANKIPREDSPTIQAMTTRGLVLRINLTFKQKKHIMKRLIDEEDFYSLIGERLKKRDRERLKNDLEKHSSIVIENFNLRSVQKLIMFYSYGKEYHPDNPRRHLELFDATTTIDEEKRTILEMMEKKLTVRQQIEQFVDKTGKSRATYYRKKKEIEGNMRD